jgi:hypothetical protein
MARIIPLTSCRPVVRLEDANERFNDIGPQSARQHGEGRDAAGANFFTETLYHTQRATEYL